MKVYRPNSNTYVIQKNELPYEVTKEENSKLHLELENERSANPNDFEIDIQEELPSIEMPPSEVEKLQQELASTNAMLLEFMESMLM